MDDTTGRTLLQLARTTIQAKLEGTSLPPVPALPEQDSPHGGLFVTLRNHGRLRGCIGEFRAGQDLAQAVQRMAIAVLGDPRFTRNPVTRDEVPDLSIDISVLSPMQRTENPELLVPGLHGIYVRRGGHGGCFLPQVAVEQGWDARDLLENCCLHKAGLSKDAWKEPGTDVFLFTAEILDEEHQSGSAE